MFNNCSRKYEKNTTLASFGPNDCPLYRFSYDFFHIWMPLFVCFSLCFPFIENVHIDHFLSFCLSQAVGLFGKGLRMLTNTVKSAAEEEYGKSGELDQAMSGLEAHSNVLNNAVQRTSDSTSPVSYQHFIVCY